MSNIKNLEGGTFFMILLLAILSAYSLYQKWSFFISFGILFLIVVVSVFHNISLRKKEFSNWIFPGIMFFYSILVLSLALFNIQWISVNFLFWILIISILIMLLAALGIWGNILFKSKKLGLIAISYIVVSVLLVSLFAGLYSSSGDISYNGEVLKDDSYAGFNYYYLSVQTFYSMSYGDFVPMKNSRMYSMIELVLSALLHIVLLGWIFSEFARRKN